MPIILITNDDGVHAEGIRALYDAIGEIATPYIVAPDRERSASSHSLTIQYPIKIARLDERIFSTSGTPTDCVAVGAEKLLPSKPVLIVSGINHGPNLGDDVTYSGTVSAAIEGTILNIPSMAVSLNIGAKDKPRHFKTAAKVAVEIASFILKQSLPYDTLLNINVPNVEYSKLKGRMITRQGRRIYEGAISETRSPWGETYYWIGGGVPLWEHGDDTDMNAVLEGGVSITPLHLDLTNYNAVDYLKQQCKTWNTPT